MRLLTCQRYQANPELEPLQDLSWQNVVILGRSELRPLLHARVQTWPYCRFLCPLVPSPDQGWSPEPMILIGLQLSSMKSIGRTNRFHPSSNWLEYLRCGRA
jgi:hypothetical protein